MQFCIYRFYPTDPKSLSVGIGIYLPYNRLYDTDICQSVLYDGGPKMGASCDFQLHVKPSGSFKSLHMFYRLPLYFPEAALAPLAIEAVNAVLQIKHITC